MVSTLKAVLLRLDPDQEDHWTDDGLPRISAVHEIGGDKSVTRAQITDAAPGLTRDTAVPPPVLLPPTPTDADPGDEANAAPEQEDGIISDLRPGELDEEPAAEPEPDVDVLNLPIAEVFGDYRLCQLALSVLSEQHDALLKQRAKLQDELADVARKIESVGRQAQVHESRDPKLTTSGAIREYLEAQARLRAKRAERALAFIAAGTTAGDVAKQLQKGSPLDRSMGSRKAALGSQRPPPRVPTS